MKLIVTAIVLGAFSNLAAAAPQAPAPTTAPAAASAAPAAPVISKQTHDDIITLLDLTFKPRMTEMTSLMTKIYLGQMRAKYSAITPAVADEITQDVNKAMDTPERTRALEEDLVPIYAQSYTDDEIHQLIAFGKTPAGAKMFAGTPNQKQLAGAMQPWTLGVLSPVVLMETAQILKAHGITMGQDQ